MKLSQSFIKTLRTAPKDETAKSAELLIRAGYLYKELAGVYDFLPFGLKVLENIKQIIREEINAIGGQELLLSTLQNPTPWQATNRWDSKDMDIWFKTELSAGGELGLAPTHEEPVTSLLKDFVTSYKDLPFSVYQFQTKFRNELRAKSGILRTREFLMKDLYSFSPDEATHNDFYQKVESAYDRIYERVGLGDCTVKAFASGGIFTKYSHEYQTIIPIGEDTIWFNADKSVVLNEEVLNDAVLNDLGVKREELNSTKACEVGNIFTLKDKFSTPLGLQFTDQNGERHPVIMGCYGIGVSRLLGVIAEKFADDKGLVWPENIAPFRYYLIGIGEEGNKVAAELYDKNPDLFLFDDRDLRPGEKFADSELLGIPHRIVISDRTLADNQAEITNRATGEITLLTIDALISKLM